MEQKPDQCPTPKGILLVIGGHENKGDDPKTAAEKGHFTDMEVLISFLSLTGKSHPVIAVITSASTEGKESFKDYEKVFKENKVKDIRHVHHYKREDVMNDAMTESISEWDAVLYAGGDQLKLTSIYGGTDFLKRLKERYIYDSLVVAGTSAGAMAMSTPMIYAGSQDVQEFTGEIKVTTGLEFMRDICVDTHFVHRGRFVRMAQVIASNPTCIGLGIEEDTAVIVRNGTDLEIKGSGCVIIIDGHHMTNTNITEFSEGKAVSIRGLEVHILARNETIKLPQYNPPHI